MDAEVKTEVNANGVLIVTLNRTESLNSLNYGLVMGVISAFDKARDDDNIRSVILTGAGRGLSLIHI